MQAEEIAARCRKAGAFVSYRARVLTDVWGSDLPYSEERWFAKYFPPRADFQVLDGMCRANGHWLPWEAYGDGWCFGDEAIQNVRSEKLKEIMICMKAKP